ncbi:MAG TPA: MarR family transcriptional regulator [Burkholderiaceae bacterium]|jgi:MarR family transcriptional regulator for hemolysin|nr:MarR family transcriptional regulator [Burkholderiaceae bacterium]
MASIEERFTAALHGTARTWRLAVDRRLKSLGMSQAAWMTVAMAAKSKEPLAQIELAQRVGVEGATMVAMLDRLAKAGLVVRTPSLTDRRVKLVTLTPQGEALYARVRSEGAAVRRRVLAGIDPKRLALATELLEQIQAAVEELP